MVFIFTVHILITYVSVTVTHDFRLIAMLEIFTHTVRRKLRVISFVTEISDFLITFIAADMPFRYRYVVLKTVAS